MMIILLQFSCFLFLFLVEGIGSRMCDGLAIDWIGNNLYWTDTDFRCIFVASLRNLSLVYKAIYGNLEHPKAITLVPSQGLVLFAVYWLFCILFCCDYQLVKCLPNTDLTVDSIIDRIVDFWQCVLYNDFVIFWLNVSQS